ncbi:hypothetical protein HNQ77_001050 [Silvibacterium bohemicum]|uniref:Uncharacterized protein n=1 Tax=Silvibacterium bohemicum TaxID=1577686 RepID=A0A841JP35_9BACT|nr:hypothetical protein [Silvibacterium bohemicum]MBB6143106.1 hypothetical protein [Silvibacterium bohemicum]
MFFLSSSSSLLESSPIILLGNMLIAGQSNFSVSSGISLRRELSRLSLGFASVHEFLHERTDGQVPSVIFGCDDDGRHGNFHPEAYRRICNNPEWAKRLEKVHTASRRSRVRADWQWKELDCANSSDALLMNIFCHPGVMRSTKVQAMLGVGADATLQFGFKPRTALHRGKRDNTEIDMKVGDLLVEAKLTESDFQSAKFHLVHRYHDLNTVFDLSALRVRKDRYSGYQLIRGALAAYVMDCSFCVFCDARRPDLVEAWYGIMCAVRLTELRCRLKLLTWQELASILPDDLQHFLAAKYGIFHG